MTPLTLEQVADVVGGDLADAGDAARRVDAVTIDSREVTHGALFVPLRGEHVDGHDFVDDAVGRGATGFLHEARRTPPALPGAVVVDDPADALLGLGAWVRDTVAPVVVALTGSSGKTTTKDLIAAAVGGRGRRRVVATPGSYNNELGVPLTCCRLEADSEVLVAEVGARGVGHIARLAPLLRPDIAVVTMVGASHLEMMRDLDTVARAKFELVASLEPDGLAVLNADDPRVAAMAGRAPGPVRTYGVEEAADWQAADVEFDELARPVFTAVGRDAGVRVRVRLPLPGAHNVGNGLAALAVADALGVDAPTAAAGLERATVSRWRMQLGHTAGGVTVLNDAYNANPASMAAALRTLAAMTPSGRRWAVLGQMAELGPGGPAEHERIGRLCVDLGLDGLVVVGGEASGIRDGAQRAGGGLPEGLAAVDGPDEAVDVVAPRLRPGDVVLVKASRAVGLERVAERLTAGPDAGADGGGDTTRGARGAAGGRGA